MSRRRFSLEEAEEDVSTDTDRKIGDDVADPSADDADTDDEEDEGDDSKPLVLPDLADLQVVKLEEMLEHQQLEERRDALHEALTQDAPLAMETLHRALEHFKVSCLTRTTASLKLAQEEQVAAQETAGVITPEVLEVPLEAADVQDAQLSDALESLGTTVSGIIKAIYAAIKKALALLKEFLRDMWRQLKSLEEAIKKRGDDILALRKRYERKLDSLVQLHSVSLTRYVQLGKYKPFLCLDGKEIALDAVMGYRESFSQLNGLLKQAPLYEKFAEELTGSFERLLKLIKENTDGQIANETIDTIFAKVPPIHTLAPLGQAALLAHGLQATDETVLDVSDEYIGNLFQVAFNPNTDFLSSNPSVVQQYAVWKIDYTTDGTKAPADDFMRVLETAEIVAAQKAALDQAQLLISAQRISDHVEHRMESLSEILRQVDSFVWQNNQGEASVAALKNQQLIALTRAVSSIEGTTNRYFTQVLTHVRNVQYAWYQYLTETFKRELEILRLSDKVA